MLIKQNLKIHFFFFFLFLYIHKYKKWYKNWKCKMLKCTWQLSDCYYFIFLFAFFFFFVLTCYSSSFKLTKSKINNLINLTRRHLFLSFLFIFLFVSNKHVFIIWNGRYTYIFFLALFYLFLFFCVVNDIIRISIYKNPHHQHEVKKKKIYHFYSILYTYHTVGILYKVYLILYFTEST